MLSFEKLTVEVQQLETYYADRLGEDASHKELSIIWDKIKYLKEQLTIVQIFNTPSPIRVRVNHLF